MSSTAISDEIGQTTKVRESTSFTDNPQILQDRSGGIEALERRLQK